jgi:hypothetical protein
VNSAAHVDATGQGDPQEGGKFHACEIIIEFIHESFNNRRAIRCRAVAMGPTLGMDNVRNAISGSPNREAHFFGGVDDGLHLFFVRCQEFDIIPAGESKVSVTILVGDITDVPDKIDADQPRRSYPYCKYLLATFSHMPENAWLHNFVIFPLPIIFLDDLG